MASIPEGRIAMIHRVIVPDVEFPKEYAILLTNRRSIFIRQEKTRSKFLLTGEMRYGTALITDVPIPRLEDYAQTSLESLAADPLNLAVPHYSVISLVLKKELPTFRYRDFWIWLTMRTQKEIFQVYHFEMTHRQDSSQVLLRFYMVPLGAWFKPKRQTQTREAILREYAEEGLRVYQRVLPPDVATAAV
jgi:hypothetical protein